MASFVWEGNHQAGERVVCPGTAERRLRARIEPFLERTHLPWPRAREFLRALGTPGDQRCQLLRVCPHWQAHRGGARLPNASEVVVEPAVAAQPLAKRGHDGKVTTAAFPNRVGSGCELTPDSRAPHQTTIRGGSRRNDWRYANKW